jgi:hypothetical protein
MEDTGVKRTWNYDGGEKMTVTCTDGRIFQYDVDVELMDVVQLVNHLHQNPGLRITRLTKTWSSEDES